MLQRRITELKSRISEGGLREAAIRGLLYVGSARGMVDERSLEALRNVRRNDPGPRLTLTEFKMLVRDQFFMLLLDREAALAAIPKLLPENATARHAAFAAIRDVLSASAAISGEVARRLKHVAALFGVDAGELSDKASTSPPSIRRRRHRSVNWQDPERHHESHARRIREKRALPASMTV